MALLVISTIKLFLMNLHIGCDTHAVDCVYVLCTMHTCVCVCVYVSNVHGVRAIVTSWCQEHTRPSNTPSVPKVEEKRCHAKPIPLQCSKRGQGPVFLSCLPCSLGWADDLGQVEQFPNHCKLGGVGVGVGGGGGVGLLVGVLVWVCIHAWYRRAWVCWCV